MLSWHCFELYQPLLDETLYSAKGFWVAVSVGFWIGSQAFGARWRFVKCGIHCMGGSMHETLGEGMNVHMDEAL